MQQIKPKRNKERFSQTRLFSEDTWPGADKETRELLAGAVVDEFHRRVREAGLNLRWVPRAGLFEVQSGRVPAVKMIGEMIEWAYEEVQMAAGT